MSNRSVTQFSRNKQKQKQGPNKTFWSKTYVPKRQQKQSTTKQT